MVADRRDTDRDGWIQINYEDFMKVSGIFDSIPLSLGCCVIVLMMMFAVYPFRFSSTLPESHYVCCCHALIMIMMVLLFYLSRVVLSAPSPPARRTMSTFFDET